jgi:hypothetical protein
MKKIYVIIYVLLFLLFSSIVSALYTENENLTASTHMGSGGYVGSIGIGVEEKRVGYFIGQNDIGPSVNSKALLHYGLLYIGSDYHVYVLFPTFVLSIEDFGIEWIKLNWSLST